MPFDADNFTERFSQAPEDVKQKIDYAIDLFARSVINTATIVDPRRVVLFGKMFKNETLRTKLIDACASYDSAYGPKRIIHTALADSEGYIGPAAVFAQLFYDAI